MADQTVRVHGFARHALFIATIACVFMVVPRPEPLAAQQAACVDLNTATITDLQTIVHMDSVQAERIVQLRETSEIRTVDDLFRVGGFTPTQLNEIRAQGRLCSPDVVTTDVAILEIPAPAPPPPGGANAASQLAGEEPAYDPSDQPTTTVAFQRTIGDPVSVSPINPRIRWPEPEPAPEPESLQDVAEIDVAEPEDISIESELREVPPAAPASPRAPRIPCGVRFVLTAEQVLCDGDWTFRLAPADSQFAGATPGSDASTAARAELSARLPIGRTVWIEVLEAGSDSVVGRIVEGPYPALPESPGPLPACIRIHERLTCAGVGAGTL